jgi:hypothetical protein
MMDDSTQDPINPLIAYAQMNAEMEEDGSEDELANLVIKRRLLEGGAGQAAPSRRRSYQLEASQASEPEPPLETEGAKEGEPEAVDREPIVDLSQPELSDPPFTEDQEDDDAMLEYFGDVCRIHIDEVRRICFPRRVLIKASEFLPIRNLLLHRPLAVGADGERALPCLVQERPRGNLKHLGVAIS